MWCDCQRAGTRLRVTCVVCQRAGALGQLSGIGRRPGLVHVGPAGAVPAGAAGTAGCVHAID